MANRTPILLIQELVRKNLITEDAALALDVRARQERKDLSDLLIEQNVISEKDLTALRSKLYKLPILDAGTLQPNPDALTLIPEDVAAFYRIVAFERDDTTLKVALVNPEDIDALEALKFVAVGKGLRLEKYIVSAQGLDKLLANNRTLSGDVGLALDALAQDATEVKAEAEASTLQLEEITAESPVIKIVGAILKHAVESRASDIHIEPFEERVRVRYRIDGALVKTLQLPRQLHPAIVTRIKILSEMKIDETRISQDGRFSLRVGSRKIDYRVSTLPTKHGEKIVMRILDPFGNDVGMEQLGFQDEPRAALERAIAKPYGSILITGPTGSGKSTTIAAVLRRLNTEDVNIVTLEDPVEYFLDGVNQSQVHEEIGYTFATGLRSILRQDPDIVVVGEVRDHETAGLATQAALTGHLVLSTLHTNDAIGVIPRLIDMGIEKYLIPPTLNVVVGQRLVRKLCKACVLTGKANVTEQEMITKAVQSMPRVYQETYVVSEGYTIQKPNINPGGCPECGGKGYKGRIGVYEVLEMTPAIEKLVLGTFSEAALRQEAERQGMLTMYQDGILKVLQGTASLQDILELVGDSSS
ncbi:MAG: ATPase, T2SS/T4P/T4SS family [Patescibacteria group bacterium]